MFKRKAIPAMAALCLFAATHANAGPNDYIRTPTVEYGEREIDIKNGVHKNRDGTTESANSIGFGFTPTS